MRSAVLILVSVLAAWGDIESVKTEPNLEKRSERALANAQTSLDRARESYQKGNDEGLKDAFEELGESIEVCKQSLDESGKNARKRPKYFKKAEIGIRQLIRRLETFKVEMSIDDREPVGKLLQRAHQLQESILEDIMGKKK